MRIFMSPKIQMILEKIQISTGGSNVAGCPWGIFCVDCMHIEIYRDNAFFRRIKEV